MLVSLLFWWPLRCFSQAMAPLPTSTATAINTVVRSRFTGGRQLVSMVSSSVPLGLAPLPSPHRFFKLQPRRRQLQVARAIPTVTAPLHPRGLLPQWTTAALLHLLINPTTERTPENAAGQTINIPKE